MSLGRGRGKSISRFLRQERGSTIGLVAVSLLTLAAASGLALDAGRGYLIKSKLSQAVDAAALAGGRATSDGSVEAAKVQIEKYFQANFPEGYLGVGAAQTKIDVAQGGGEIKVSAAVTVPTTLLSVLDIRGYEVSASATVSLTMRSLEIAMILDNSRDVSWIYMTEMQDRAKDFLDAISVGSESAEDVSVAVVPFAARANVMGQENINAEAPADPDHVCMDQRPSYHAIGETDPRTEPFDHYSGTYAPKKDWTGYKDRICPQAMVTPLTRDRGVLDATLDQMEGRGCRRYDLGMAWGWRTLSPEWQGVWQGRSVTEPADYTNANVTKVAIIGTHSSNTPRTCSDDPETIAETARMFAEACDGMKQEGILVYAIVYVTDYSDLWNWDKESAADTDRPGPAEAARELFEDCTSGAERAFFPESREELESAVASIANDLKGLRLTR